MSYFTDDDGFYNPGDYRDGPSREDLELYAEEHERWMAQVRADYAEQLRQRRERGEYATHPEPFDTPEPDLDSGSDEFAEVW